MIRLRILAVILMFLTVSSIFGQTYSTFDPDIYEEKYENQFHPYALPLPLTSGYEIDSSNIIASSVNYIITPGDKYTFTIALSGRVENYVITAEKNKSFQVPYLGEVNFSGSTFSQIKEYIVNNIKKRIPADFIDFKLTQPASFEVFIGGFVFKPSLYIATPLYRMNELIGAAGGIKLGGSYRKIQIKHEDGTESIIDLSQFISNGDYRFNPFIKPGDKILVPPADILVALTGEITHNGIFELREGETLYDLIQMAGGFHELSFTTSVKLTRTYDNDRSTYIDVLFPDLANFKLQNGDKVVIRSKERKLDHITAAGALKSVNQNDPLHPLAFSEGLTLFFALELLGGPTIEADPDQSKIYRSNGEIINFDIFDVWNYPENHEPIVLLPGDHIEVPLRDRFVTIIGEVKQPGILQYHKYKKFKFYLDRCGGITKEGMGGELFLVEPITGRKLRQITSDYIIQPGDVIQLTKNKLHETITVVGETLAFAASVVALITATETLLKNIGILQ